MVVVPKKTGSVRICVDLKPLNKSILRELHPLLKVDEIPGAKHLTKLDANSGFWQIPLAEESHPLTTFVDTTSTSFLSAYPALQNSFSIKRARFWKAW